MHLMIQTICKSYKYSIQLFIRTHTHTYILLDPISLSLLFIYIKEAARIKKKTTRKKYIKMRKIMYKM